MSIRLRKDDFIGAIEHYFFITLRIKRIISKIGFMKCLNIASVPIEQQERIMSDITSCTEFTCTVNTNKVLTTRQKGLKAA